MTSRGVSRVSRSLLFAAAAVEAFTATQGVRRTSPGVVDKDPVMVGGQLPDGGSGGVYLAFALPH